MCAATAFKRRRKRRLVMQTIRDFWGTWLLVGALAVAVVGVWGFEEPATPNAQTVACEDGVSRDNLAGLQGVDAPRNGWRPSPELTGLPPRGGDRLTSYEVAEERNLAATAPADEAAAMAQGSITSLNPISMC
jgi:hypothetical protein